MSTIDASAINTFQQCARRSVLSRDWRYRHWRPKLLFDRTLKSAIFRLSGGQPVEECASEAQSEFMSEATNPGLDIATRDPYKVAKDWCAMLDTILRSLTKITLLTLHKPASVSLSPSLQWDFKSFADETGTLHRWITVDSWTDDDFFRQLHGWHVMGDIAVSRCPMTLHVIIIGQERNGRRSSPWARIYRNPDMPHLKMHFCTKLGRPLKGWEPVYLSDLPNYDVDAWVEQMWSEGAAQPLLHHLDIKVPSDGVCDDTIIQIKDVSNGMNHVLGMHYAGIPMNRGACDFPVTCWFQNVCYKEGLVNIGSLGLYEFRDRVSSEATAK